MIENSLNLGIIPDNDRIPGNDHNNSMVTQNRQNNLDEPGSTFGKSFNQQKCYDASLDTQFLHKIETFLIFTPRNPPLFSGRPPLPLVIFS